MSLAHIGAVAPVGFEAIADTVANALVDASKAVASRVAGIIAAIRNRGAFADIAAMGDAQLRDIGLTSADVHFARGVSLGEDPTLALARLAGERRRRPGPTAH